MPRFKKIAALTPEGRAQVAPKNFALNADQSSTGKRSYPIHDEQHARAALGFVGMHGSPEEKAEVYKDVAKKYPGLAAKSSIPGLRARVEEKVKKARFLEVLEKEAGLAFSGLKGMTTGANIAKAVPKLPMPKPMGQIGVAQNIQNKIQTLRPNMRAMSKVNPTMMASEQVANTYKSLPGHLQQMIENSDPVKKWGVRPEAALQVAWMGKMPHEGIDEVIARHDLHGGARPAAPAAMATGQTLATKVGNAMPPTPGGMTLPTPQAPLQASGLQKLPGVQSNVGVTPDSMKMAALGQYLRKVVSDPGHHKTELAGLGILAGPSVDHLQAKIRSGIAGEGEEGVKKRQIMGETGHAISELAGLGVLAAPSISHLVRK